MIQVEYRWRNFKPFIDTGWVEIKPLTILIGANNSGKSSFIAPLLILKQTLADMRGSSPLVLRGELVNAGSFSDIVYKHDANETVTFQIRFFERPESGEVPDLGEVPPVQCSMTFRAIGKEGEFVLQEYQIADAYDRVMISRNRAEDRSRYTLDRISDWATETEDDDDLTTSHANRAAEQAIREDRPFHFFFTGRDVVRKALSALPERASIDKSSDHPEETWIGEGPAPLQLSSFVAKYLSAVSIIDHYVRDHALNFVFLGPLRENPRRLYELSGGTPRDVGIRGQFSPELLRLNQRRPVFKEVNRWLKEFGLSGNLSAKRVNEAAFTLTLDTGNSITNFADVGFGYSQLLPLIVQGVIGSSSDGLMIAEQPEIHLNPRLQAKLATLFREITKRDAAILVETHSEHLLLAIRRLVAEGSLQSDNVAIYFVESGEEGSKIRSVPLQANGHIDPSDWPKGFFEDSLRESLGLASAQARRINAD